MDHTLPNRGVAVQRLIRALGDVQLAGQVSNTVQVLDHGSVADMVNLDDFLEDNWDELYATAALSR